MKNAKMKKRALFTSLLALFLSCSMLIGTTYAWFTDTVTSGVNKIVAGNLDVEAYYKEGNEWKDLSDAGDYDLFKDTLWEPGKVQYANLKVVNEGTLALKYALSVNFMNENTVVLANGDSTEYKLSDVIKVAFIEDGIDETKLTGTEEENRVAVIEMAKAAGLNSIKSMETVGQLEPDAEDKLYGVILYWEPTADDNNWNLNNGKTATEIANVEGSKEKLMITLGIKLEATQLEYEKDSFGPNYDAGAALEMLPSGVTEDSYTQAEKVYTYLKNGVIGLSETNNPAFAYYNGKYYDGLSSALMAVRLSDSTGDNVIYLKPNATTSYEVGYSYVTKSVTIYGNNATLPKDESKHRLAVEAAAGEYFESDVTINVYNLNGVVVWGNRETAYTLNVNLYNCDVNRVYINKVSGVNNINIENSTFDAATFANADTSVYSNAPGTIVVNNSTFSNIGVPFNFNNKSEGTQNITITNNTFVDCAVAGTPDYYAPVRLFTATANAVTNLTMEGNTITYSGTNKPINGADVLLNVDYTSGSDNVTKSAFGIINATVQSDATVKSGNNVSLNGEYQYTMTTQTIEGVEVTLTTESFDSIVRNKNNAATINSMEVYTADDLKAVAALIEKGVMVANGTNDIDAVIKFKSDIDYGGADWKAIGKDIDIEGNGCTLSNVNFVANANGQAGIYSYSGNCDVDGLTLKDITVTGSQAGAFAGNATNTHLTDCALKGTITVNWIATSDPYNGVGAVFGVTSDMTNTIDVDVSNATIVINNTDITYPEGYAAETGTNLVGVKYGGTYTIIQ